MQRSKLTGEAKYLSNLDGRLNGVQVLVSGAGTINEVSGVTIGSYVCDLGDQAVDLRVLSACLITGYPNVCAESADVRNPFRGGAYQYSRDVQFESGHLLTVKAAVWLTDGMLDSHFSVDGTVPIGELGIALPLREEWTQEAPGIIEGRFRFGWEREDGTRSFANAYSRYVLSSKSVLMRSLLRHLEIDAGVVDSTLSLHQRSRLDSTLTSL